MAGPLTPLEQGGTWATYAETNAFLADVAVSARVKSLDVVGQSALGGFNIYRAEVTTSTDPTAPTVLIVGGQHGDESAGKEAALRWTRDLAFTDDPLWLDLLGRARFVAIPDCNPWGNNFNSRITRTADGVNVDTNRDHIELRTNEARAVQQAITDYAPVLVIDFHEVYPPGSDATWKDVLVKESQLGPVDAELKALGGNMVDHVLAELTSQGIGNGRYGQSSSPTLNNVSALRHAQSILVESPRMDSDPNRTDEWRTSLAMATVNAIMTGLDTLLEPFAQATAGAPGRATTKATSREPFPLGDTTISPAPTGYADLASWPWQLDLFNVTGTTTSVSMVQPAYPLIPFLLDPVSTDALTTATRVAPTPPPTYTQSGTPLRVRANVDGTTLDVGLIRYGSPGGTVTVWERP